MKKQTMALKVVRIGNIEKGKVQIARKVKVFESVKEKVKVFGNGEVKENR